MDVDELLDMFKEMCDSYDDCSICPIDCYCGGNPDFLEYVIHVVDAFSASKEDSL